MKLCVCVCQGVNVFWYNLCRSVSLWLNSHWDNHLLRLRLCVCVYIWGELDSNICFLSHLCSGPGAAESPQGEPGGEGLRESLSELHLWIHFQQLPWPLQQGISDRPCKSVCVFADDAVKSFIALTTKRSSMNTAAEKWAHYLLVSSVKGSPSGWAGSQHQEPRLLVQTHHPHRLHHRGGQELLHSLP